MKKQIVKALGAAFLALALAVTAVPSSFSLALTQSGDFQRNGNSILSYTGTAEAVSIPGGVTEIAAESFSNQAGLTSVSMPASLEIIGNGAFRNCSSIENVKFNKGLATIESGAFSGCDKLSSVTFSDSIRYLGAGVFSGDQKLATVSLGKNPYFVVNDGALYNRDKTKLIQVFAGRKGDTFVMPDSVQEIERYAFWGCKKLKNVTLSSNLQEISEYAFSNCSNLKQINIPYSLRTISAKAFEDCTSLGNIQIPASVTKIHDTAFDGCNNLRIISEVGTTAYEFFLRFDNSQSALEEYENSVSANAIGNYYSQLFLNHKKEETSNQDDEEAEEEIKKEDKKPEFDPNKPADVSDLEVSAYYAKDGNDVLGTTRIVGNQAVVMMGNSGQTADVSDEVVESVSNPNEPAADEKLILDNDLHKIARKSYYQYSSLEKAALQKGIQEIDDFAFARSSLESVRIPDSVTNIGYGAFYHCDNLDTIYMSNSVTDIAPEAFENTPYLWNWQNNVETSDFLIVGDGILIAYKGNQAVVNIPATVKKIAGNAFREHPELESVNLGNTVVEIGEAAFENCPNLQKISGMDSLVAIKDRAFDGCPVAGLELKNALSEVGLGAFANANTNSVVIHGNVPKLTYEKTATRLSNNSFRKPVFSNNISVALIDNESQELQGTILDENGAGLKGLTVYFVGGAGGDKQVAIKRCSLRPDPVSGMVKVPETVSINGENVTIAKADRNAFAPYESIENWCEDKLTNIVLPPTIGTIKDYEPNLSLSGAIDFNNLPDPSEEGSAEPAQDNAGSAQENASGDEAEKDKLVQTYDLGSGLVSGELASATCKGDDQKYILLLSKAENESMLRDAATREYGSMVNGQLTVLDLKLVEAASNVPISNFGKEIVSVKLPISEGMANQDLCMLTLNEDGKLQTIYGIKTKEEDQNYFLFQTNHFSAYGLYAGIGDMAAVIRAESAKLSSLDPSPDTGDTFAWKPVLAILLACIGGILLLNQSVIASLFEKKKME